jgi:hypothetical protein
MYNKPSLVMKKLLVHLLFILVVSGCGNNSNPNESVTKKKKWYEGGNLHKSQIREWKNATEENKLATCADFIAYIDKEVSMDILLERSIELRACINEATKGMESVNNESVPNIATLCILTLGYK